jgi:hypothetical protein
VKALISIIQSIKEIAVNRNAQGFDENKTVARIGVKIAGVQGGNWSREMVELSLLRKIIRIVL